MNNLTTSIIVFACVFGGALLGMYLRRRLPAHHLDASSSDVIKTGMALTGTMAALLLSLQLGSAKSAFDAMSDDVRNLSTNLILLDRSLTYYGPDAQPARDLLHQNARQVLAELWSPDSKLPSGSGGASRTALFGSIQALTPSTQEQRTAKAGAMSIAFDLGRTRWLMVSEQYNSASLPLIVVLVFWLTIIFVSYGLLAPRNATVVCALLASASSIAGAIFLLLEMQAPFSGVIRTSSEPLRHAIALLGH